MMRHRLLLMTVGMLFSVLAVQGARVTFFATDQPEGVGEMTAYSGSTQLQSGAIVSTGTRVTFKIQEAQGYVIDWYVDETLVDEAAGYTYTQVVTKSITVEARYHLPFKVIFDGTPFYKHAGLRNLVYLTQNYYHHRSDQVRAFGYSVSGWNGDDGKFYAVDNIPTDTTFTKIKLTHDMVLSPVYVLNEEDLGDGTVTPVWEFGYPDSMVVFNNFQGKCSFVKPVLYNSYYCDINMTCDATEGLIHNIGRTTEGNAIVKKGTRFTLPSRYGTVYTLRTREPLSATTIAGRTDYESTWQADTLLTSLRYWNSQTDSIEIVIGEDISLFSISASFPGGDTTPEWTPNLKIAETSIGTRLKTGESGCLLYDMSDITNNGNLVITPSAVDSLTSQIEMTLKKNAQRYMSVSFQVAEGFSFKPTDISIPLKLEGSGTAGTVEIIISDERGNKIDTLIANHKAGILVLDTLMNKSKLQEVYLYGKITLKWYVYGATAKYRLGAPIHIYGEICETVTCGEGNNWATYVTKTPIDKDGMALLQIDVFDVVGVREKDLLITKIAMEEIPMGIPVLLHTDVAGAIYNIPLTRCDDAFEPGNSLLKISDGTDIADRVKYFFRKQNNVYAFHMDNDGHVIPEGDVFLEYDTFYDPPMLYLSKEDVPTGVEGVSSDHFVRKTTKVLKNGQVYIMKPDGSVYTLDGERVM